MGRRRAEPDLHVAVWEVGRRGACRQGEARFIVVSGIPYASFVSPSIVPRASAKKARNPSPTSLPTSEPTKRPLTCSAATTTDDGRAAGMDEARLGPQQRKGARGEPRCRRVASAAIDIPTPRPQLRMILLENNVHHSASRKGDLIKCAPSPVSRRIRRVDASPCSLFEDKVRPETPVSPPLRVTCQKGFSSLSRGADASQAVSQGATVGERHH